MAMEYGKCYRLINADSKLPLAPNNDYRTDQENSIWQFRVCHNIKDCTPGGTVKADHKFVLNDVIGKVGEGLWFICQGAHYRVCKDEKSVKQFSARKWCISGSCGICLTAPPTGIGRVCPSGRSLGNNKNERLCMPFIVEEVACLAKNPLLNGKDKPNGDFRSGDGKDVFREL